MRRAARDDLARTTFGVLVIGVLLAATLWILRPFLGPGIWAVMVVVTTWPLMLRLQRGLWGKRWLAVVVMTVALVLLFVVPLTAAVVTIVGNADRLVGWARFVATFRLPDAPPEWLVALPVVGTMAARAWHEAAALGLTDLLPRLSPYAGNLTRWFVAEIGGIGVLLLQFLLTVIISAVLYARGEVAAQLARRFAARLGGKRGASAVELAGYAIRGVALGVGGTAVVQSLLGGLGVALAGVPFAGLLTALMFMSCLVQLGPAPVLLGSAVWAYVDGSTSWAVALVVWAGVVGTLDNVLRPLLIRLGAELPLLLIFGGVIGGLFAFGLVGIFVGPVVLAVAYTLLEAWIGDVELPPAPQLPPPAHEPVPPLRD